MRICVVFSICLLLVTLAFGATNDEFKKAAKENKVFARIVLAMEEAQTMFNASTPECKVLIGELDGKTVNDANITSTFYNGVAPSADELDIWNDGLTACVDIVNQKAAWSTTVINPKVTP